MVPPGGCSRPAFGIALTQLSRPRAATPAQADPTQRRDAGEGLDAGPTHASATASRSGRWLAAAAPALALFAGALAVRSLGWPEVFTERGLRLVGPDAHYHLRRIAWSVEHFPSWLSRDEYVAFPNGGEPIWSPPPT